LTKFNLGIDTKPQMVKIKCIARNNQGVGSGIVVEGIQRCFYMDIQGSERDSTKASIT
jgi:hypothetical protein